MAEHVDVDERLSLEELASSLPSYALVVDTAGDACPGIDTACAVLGVPYLGPSPWWPPVVGVVEPDEASAVRRLFTDQGYAAWRRDVAHRAVTGALGPEAVRAVELLAQGVRPDAGAEVVA